MKARIPGVSRVPLRRRFAIALSGVALTAAACGGAPTTGAAPPPAGTPEPAPMPGDTSTSSEPTVDEAVAFMKGVNKTLKQLYIEAERMAWVKSTYITHDTEVLAATANERLMEYQARTIKEATRFDDLELPPDTARQLYLLKYSAGLPAPSNPDERSELASIETKMGSIYGKGKPCSPKFKGHGKDKKAECLALGELSNILAKKRDYDLLLEVWKQWRTISPEMRPMYQRFVELGNKGATELGFQDMGQIWKGRYDMSGEAFTKEMDRLWTEVKPLYDELHCYVRAKLRKKYGTDKIGEKAPIPAHVLGNMWAQEWTNVYDMVVPFKGKKLPDVGKQLKRKKYDEKKMVQLGEKFFTSLGMDPLPKTFYERSQFTKPRDREVVCHASAWDITYDRDLRIKMCIQINYEDLVTIHHELGHNYYYNYYYKLPVLYQAGANDGFHEGIGDTLALSVTPSYLAKVGLYDKVPKSEQVDLNVLMLRALEGIAFLPFGKLMDEWRWDIFSGKTPPSKYNESWWALRKKYQGVAPPVARSEKDFDPGAKYHIPGNVPYTRYFIARILQYQFHRALCEAMGHEGPLHQCSIYGNKKAGDKMISMLKLGASKPWPDALEAISGEREMSATAIIDYYKPLIAWLKEQNKGETCGW